MIDLIVNCFGALMCEMDNFDLSRGKLLGRPIYKLLVA